MSSGDSKGRGWTGGDGNFVEQLVGLGFEKSLDVETDYDVYVGKGGSDCGFFHHYIVLASSQHEALIFELAKTQDDEGKNVVVPNVRAFSLARDGDPDYKITVTITLRYVWNGVEL